MTGHLVGEKSIPQCILSLRIAVGVPSCNQVELGAKASFNDFQTPLKHVSAVGDEFPSIGELVFWFGKDYRMSTWKLNLKHEFQYKIFSNRVIFGVLDIYICEM